MSDFIESPIFTEEIAAAALAAGASHSVTFEETDDEAKYLPYNHLVITNLSQQNLRMEYLPDRGKLVPAGSIIEINKRGIRSVTITNLGSVANDAIIEIMLYRAPSVDEIALAQVKHLDIIAYLNGVGG